MTSPLAKNAVLTEDLPSGVKPLLLKQSGYPVEGQAGKESVTHAADGAVVAKIPWQILDGAAARTLTLTGATLENYVGQEIRFMATGAAAAHVITGEVGTTLIQGNLKCTFEGAAAYETLTLAVVSPTLAIVVDADNTFVLA